MRNTLPTRVFDDELALKVGDKDVLLKTVGPAHTKGDVMVHVPEDRTVFTGDILFVEGHPVLWAGPVDNWVATCDQILALDRFAGWGDSERMVVNVASLYREFGSSQELDVLQLFGEMGRFHAELQAKTATHDHVHAH